MYFYGFAECLPVFHTWYLLFFLYWQLGHYDCLANYSECCSGSHTVICWWSKRNNWRIAVGLLTSTLRVWAGLHLLTKVCLFFLVEVFLRAGEMLLKIRKTWVIHCSQMDCQWSKPLENEAQWLTLVYTSVYSIISHLVILVRCIFLVLVTAFLPVTNKDQWPRTGIFSVSPPLWFCFL